MTVPRLDKQAVLDAVRKGHDVVPAIAAVVGLRNPQVSTLLNRLRREGSVVDAGRVHRNNTMMVQWKIMEPGAVPAPVGAGENPFRNYEAPASLTAAILGDPRPGLSALDRRAKSGTESFPTEVMP